MRPILAVVRNHIQNRSEEGIMRTFLKSSVVWQFSVGFVLGAVGLVALQPVDGRHALVSHFTPEAVFQR